MANTIIDYFNRLETEMLWHAVGSAYKLVDRSDFWYTIDGFYVDAYCDDILMASYDPTVSMAYRWFKNPCFYPIMADTADRMNRMLSDINNLSDADFASFNSRFERIARDEARIAFLKQSIKSIAIVI